MNIDYHIAGPFLFNPLKHHLGYIQSFINHITDEPGSYSSDLRREINHLGSSVMDVYNGKLLTEEIVKEIHAFLFNKNLLESVSFKNWTGTDKKSFRIISLSDGSQWTIRYNNNKSRYIHIFPARYSPNTFRVKSNTLKSAIIFLVLSGRNIVTVDEVNMGRFLAGLSPVKNLIDSEAITKLIEILRAKNNFAGD